MKNLNIIILAAGGGTRMRSNVPKVLHTLAGCPLLQHVVRAVEPLKAEGIYVVYGHGGQQVREALAELPVEWVEQMQLLGTGHAVQQVIPHLSGMGRVLIVCGDTPLMRTEMLARLVEDTPEDAVGWLTAQVEDPRGFGRIVRNRRGEVCEIVEEKDATDEQKEITEINTGICVVPVVQLIEWLPKLQNDNAQKEYYLPDIFAMAIDDKVAVHAYVAEASYEVLGVNDHQQLAYLERIFQRNQAEKYMQQGLQLIDPNRFDVRGAFIFEKDVVVDVNVVLEGKVFVGNHCRIGPNVWLKNVRIADDVVVHANSVVEDAIIGNGCVIGPFARIRPETELKDKAKVGNFVEVKKSQVGEGTKINHLSYIGDSTLGRNVNVGAGTITCNYDGVHKYHTIIEDEVFVGSCAQFVAPVKVGKGATVGAGSTITKDVPEGKLTLARAKQVTIEDWLSPKERKE